MQLYTVIWRDAGDDFMVTEVRTSQDPQEMVSFDWVQRAAEIEYVDWDDADRIAAIADLLTDGFDLLAVVKGKLEYVA